MKPQRPLTILGIETSCDETAAAVVSNGVKVHSNIIATSLKDHQQFGGIIPEIASRRQIEFIHWVVAEALAQAKMKLGDIDAIAAKIFELDLLSIFILECMLIQEISQRSSHRCSIASGRLIIALGSLQAFHCCCYFDFIISL